MQWKRLGRLIKSRQYTRQVIATIYTIIGLNSVSLSVSRRSQTAGRNSCSIGSGNVLIVRIV